MLQILTTDGARAWLVRRVRNAQILVAASFAASLMLAAAAILTRAYMTLGYFSLTDFSDIVIIGRRGGAPIRFYPMLALSLVVLAAVFGAFGVWFVRRRTKMAKRILPVLAAGARLDAVVSGAQVSQTKRGTMQYSRLVVWVATGHGQAYAAALEEPVGSPLPEVEPQMPAAVWHGSDGRHVIAAGDALFEGAAA